MIYETSETSTSPERVAISTPESGVKPIEISYDFPFLIAQIDEPAPKWHEIIVNSSSGLFIIAAVCIAMYWWLIPCAPEHGIWNTIRTERYT